MERQTVLVGAVVFLAFSLGGFYLAFTAQDSEQKFASGMDVRVDQDTSVATAEFDGHSVDLMHEDSKKARFYLDLDRDGSFDLEIEGLAHDGETHRVNRTVTMNSTNYRLYFRYSDDGEEENDSWMELYRVLEVA